jgi:hypothetical protein
MADQFRNIHNSAGGPNPAFGLGERNMADDLTQRKLGKGRRKKPSWWRRLLRRPTA